MESCVAVAIAIDEAVQVGVFWWEQRLCWERTPFLANLPSTIAFVLLHVSVTTD